MVNTEIDIAFNRLMDAGRKLISAHSTLHDEMKQAAIDSGYTAEEITDILRKAEAIADSLLWDD
jgi:hypothetical protein